MTNTNKPNTTLPSSIEELLDYLQEQDVEEFASKLVSDYLSRLSRS